MYAYELLDREACGIGEVRQVVSYVEGFLIRRHLAGVGDQRPQPPVRRHDRAAPAEVSFADAVRQVLSGERRHWPTDAQIVEAVKTRPAAIAAIPAGRWTTYGDLAQLGGTAPVPVGQHVANTLGLPNAYRVLGANGAPRPNFHWNDPDDDRDIVDVLMAEGIILSDSGAAAQHQRIGAEELVALIETPDEDDDAGLDPVAMDAGIAA